jgi:hypothetical protein
MYSEQKNHNFNQYKCSRVCQRKFFASNVVIRLIGNTVPGKKEVQLHKTRQTTSVFTFLKSYFPYFYPQISLVVMIQCQNMLLK